jgi:hypothetical protein
VAGTLDLSYAATNARGLRPRRFGAGADAVSGEVVIPFAIAGCPSFPSRAIVAPRSPEMEIESLRFIFQKAGFATSKPRQRLAYTCEEASAGGDQSGIGTLNRRLARPRSISASITASPIGPWTSSGRPSEGRNPTEAHVAGVGAQASLGQ